MRIVVGLALMHVVPIVRVILRRLLTIDEGHSLDVVLLMMVLAVVTALNQFSLCSFQANRANSFCSIARNVHVCHRLVRMTVVLGPMYSTSLLLAMELTTELTARLHWRQQWRTVRSKPIHFCQFLISALLVISSMWHRWLLLGSTVSSLWQ